MIGGMGKLHNRIRETIRRLSERLALALLRRAFPEWGRTLPSNVEGFLVFAQVPAPPMEFAAWTDANGEWVHGRRIEESSRLSFPLVLRGG